MQRVVNSLFSMALCLAVPAKAEDVFTFPTEEAARDWAEKASWGGSSVHRLTYKDKQLLVVIRSHTSGLQTAQPSVFVKTQGNWVMVLEGDTCPCVLDFTIQDGFLVFRPVREPSAPYVRLNLETLPCK